MTAINAIATPPEPTGTTEKATATKGPVDELATLTKASGAPRVEALIEQHMRRFPGIGTKSSHAYFEAVHQALAPLARELERENARLRDALQPTRRDPDDWRDLDTAQQIARAALA